jgi:hypothetical protein
MESSKLITLTELLNLNSEDLILLKDTDILKELFKIFAMMPVEEPP